MRCNWVEQKVTNGLAPWIAEDGVMQLFAQPWYGDGTNYRGIVKHREWTLTLSQRFRTLGLCQWFVELAAEKMARIYNDT